MAVLRRRPRFITRSVGVELLDLGARLLEVGLPRLLVAHGLIPRPRGLAPGRVPRARGGARRPRPRPRRRPSRAGPCAVGPAARLREPDAPRLRAGAGFSTAGAAPPSPTGSRSRTMLAAWNSPRSSSSPATARRVSRARSTLAALAASPSASTTGLHHPLHRLPMGGDRLAQVRRALAGERRLLGGGQLLAGLDQRLGRLRVGAGRLVDRPRGHARLAELLDPVRLLALAVGAQPLGQPRRARR